MERFRFDIDMTKDIKLNVGSKLEVPINATQSLVTNSFKSGDTLHLNNLYVGTQSVRDFSGQYTISSVPTVDSYIILDISNNAALVNYGSTASLPLTLNSSLANMPYFSLNKGKKIRITRISNSTVLRERYTINIVDVQ